MPNEKRKRDTKWKASTQPRSPKGRENSLQFHVTVHSDKTLKNGESLPCGDGWGLLPADKPADPNAKKGTSLQNNQNSPWNHPSQPNRSDHLSKDRTDKAPSIKPTHPGSMIANCVRH